MTEEQKQAVKSFLYAIKNAVMAMDIDHLSDEALSSVFGGFVDVLAATEAESSASSSSQSI